MKLRARLSATVAALSLATLGGSFFAVYKANNRAQERQLDDALVHEAHEEANEAATGGGDDLKISARPGPQANDTGPLTKYAVIYAPNDRVLDATESFGGALPRQLREPLGRPFDLWHGKEHLRAVLVPIPGALHTRLLLAAPRTDLDGDEAFLGRAMLSVFAFAFGWVVLVSTWVVRTFTRGHEAVAEVARKVADGDLDARVRLSARDDEVAQLGRDVNQMIAQLSALLSNHQVFIAHAAHELRSPLTALYGELSHALRKSRSADEYEQAIEEALDATKRLMALAEDLLALARLADRDVEPPQKVELGALVEHLSRTLTAESQQRGVPIEIEGQAGAVAGRPLDLERLLRNLLENALRHAPQGSPVRVVLEGGPERRVRVANRGGPIPESDRERIFEPFWRGAYASADGHPGAGLGLAIARQIAVGHGGQLALAAPEGDAVEFVLSLPPG
ncbi:MAG TPA: ATP-binding protein [Polyangiales bacterium]|nr:ATP-binding protein [Polyangiales bacterium]